MSDERQWKAWEYPLKKWPREEKFWLDMTTRTLSALVATAVIGVAAVIIGIGTPEQRAALSKVLGLFGLASVWSVLIPIIVGALDRVHQHHEKKNPRHTVLKVTATDYQIVPSTGRHREYLDVKLTRKNYPFWHEHRDEILDALLDETGLHFNPPPPYYKDTYDEYSNEISDRYKHKLGNEIQGFPPP